jgi:hypothetical protein
MSFFIYPHKFDACHVHFGPATQNQTTENPDNKFSRMIYSTNNISLNSLGFVMHFVPTKTAHMPYSNHKWLMAYDADHPTNAGIIAQLCRIECSIVEKFTHSVLGEPRQCTYPIAEHLNSGCIKAYSHHQYQHQYPPHQHPYPYQYPYQYHHLPHPHHHADDDHSQSTDDETSASDACDPCIRFQLVVNIFGVWETRTQCGLVYKFTKW